MLPRRGYEPLVDEDGDARPNRDTGTTGSAENGRGRSDGGEPEPDDEGMTIRVLDVQGHYYPLRVQPKTTVRELKHLLIDPTGVEFGRQRIIHGGKMLADADTMASQKISDGAAVHLFQRPKAAAIRSAGGGDNSTVDYTPAQQPGRLHELPPVLVQIQGGDASGASGYVTRSNHWEVDGPRKQIRFLASFLLLISTMQLLECLASISAAISYNGAAGTGGGGGGAPHDLPDDYWVLVTGRSVSSMMGIVVGVLGIRGSQSLNTHTIRMYFIGLVLCAIVAMVIRIEVLVDIINGKIPFGDSGVASPNSSDAYPGEGDDGPEKGGGGYGPRGRAEGGREGQQQTAEEAQSRLFFTALSAFISVVASGAVWLLCILRVNDMQSQIYQHMIVYDRRTATEASERAHPNALMNPISDPGLERRDQGGAIV